MVEPVGGLPWAVERGTAWWYTEAMHDEPTSQALRAYVDRAGGRLAQDIHLSVEAGVVALDGRVASPTHARAIVDLVGAHEAVSTVIDRLTVTSEAHSSRSTA